MSTLFEDDTKITTYCNDYQQQQRGGGDGGDAAGGGGGEDGGDDTGDYSDTTLHDEYEDMDDYYGFNKL